ncbi:unnamed protein product [Onchocerca ochengi]|uniref:Uncharacterized protein n=1 Tax=Onchocerca ochengi TaxID=42157 RepID=A0A182E0P9_ONCOC|nr:unnamed protein product [Onchocerca ochengi]
MNSNESTRQILSFPIHERSKAVVHLAVHLENGQGVYFTAANMQQIAPHPPATTLTAFFTYVKLTHLRKHSKALIMIENFCLQIADKVPNQLGMPSPNRSAAASFDVELHREQNYNTTDLLSYMESNIPKLTFVLENLK